MNLTTLFSIAYASTSDDLSIEDITAAMANSVDAAFVGLMLRNTTPRFATTTARDAYYTAVGIPPTLGMLCVITADEITYRYNGTTWKKWSSDWANYVPTLTNLTLGSGTLVSRYKFDLGRVLVEGSFTYGAGSAVGSGPKISNPVNADTLTAVAAFPSGLARYLDAGVQLYLGVISPLNATTSEFYVHNVSATYETVTALSATIPFTFGTGDVLAWHYEYTPA